LRRTMALSRDNDVTANRILLALPADVFERVRSEMELVELPNQKVIYKVEDPINHLYFVERGLISLIKTMRDGRTVEIGVIGIEGMACPNAIFGLNTAILEAVVQIPGTALRLDRKLFLSEIDRSDDARALMRRYMQFAIGELAQTAACNRLHSMEERCCRWLMIAHDSARSDTFSLTHEFLAMMLGVQRAGVSITASILQRAGYIRYTRGRVTITNRSGLEGAACECYAATRAQLDQLLRLAGDHRGRMMIQHA
jgi:CRP-like cAMP-binding protein